MKRNNLREFDIHMSVHRNVIPYYSQQMQLFLIYLFLQTLHMFQAVPPPINQKHTTVYTASGIVKPILLLAAAMEEMEREYTKHTTIYKTIKKNKKKSLHCNTSLHFTTLHPTTLHYTHRHFTPSHLHFTTLSFGLSHLCFLPLYSTSHH